MKAQPLSDVGLDALQEIVNIAMGQAGSSLARLLDVYVHLSVPHIRLVSSGRVAEVVSGLVGDGPVTAVRQAFYSALRGEAVVVFGHGGCHDLADLMGYGGDVSPEQETELFLDVSNILIGACINGIAEQLGIDLSYSPPSVMGARVAIPDLLAASNLSWDQALLLQVHFGLEGREFTANLLMLLPDGAFGRLREALDAFIARL